MCWLSSIILQQKMESNSVRIVFVCVSFLLQFHRMDTLKCGTVNIVRPTILGGTETIKGEWPFIVAIHHRSDYICGGTIISYSHILTAAHCIQNKYRETALSSHEMFVRMGAFNLTDTSEKGAVQRNVSEYFIHPDWDPFENTFDADIAILVLSENITFTDSIQPVCMPASGVTTNVKGSVVGYVVRESTIRAEIPRRIVVRSVSSSYCFREESAIAAYTSNRTFCGGNGDGSPDLGDSGSGFFFTPGFTWAQYGLVSVLHTNATGNVIPHAFHLYTNITMFKDWIVETVNRTGGEVGEARKNIVMNCRYDMVLDPVDSLVYRCSLYNIDIQGSDFESGSFVGSHTSRKTQQDVTEIYFANGTMSYLPSGFGLFFDNIESLIVGEPRYKSFGEPNFKSMGTKVVRPTDLMNLRNLRKLRFLRNDIETLHKSALWNLPNLQIFELVENKLTVLHNETFSRNRKLSEVYLNSNQIDYLPPNLFRYNPKLRNVNFEFNFLKTIDENIFKMNRRLNGISFQSNRLETLPEGLFRSNVYLTVVQVENNALSSIDENLFVTNTKLLRVYFSSNRIESLPPTLFRDNLLLFSVIFGNNSITTIHDNLFINNKGLFAVSFSNNRLERLSEGIFKGTPVLNILDLSGNRLSAIDIDFAKLEHVTSINLNGNHCVSAVYRKGRENLLKFQEVVRANCSNGPQ